MDNVHLDNDALKAKIRSCNTLNTFYHETRQEIDTLSKQIFRRDNLIADLKARLGKYESTCINVEGHDPVVIGPSKSLLESLCKEICKLKQKLKEAEMNASEQAEISQKEIQLLHLQLREKERELDRVRRGPDHEKDQEIRRLCSALEERDRATATRAVLCDSLAQEADQLRGQLGATVRVCQELLGRLEREKKGGMTTAEEEKEQRRVKESLASEGSEAAPVDALLRQLQEENQQLKQRVAYVEGLNARWQKYDSSREEYVRGLCQRLKDSSVLATPSPGPGAGVGLVAGLGSPSSGLLQQEITRLNGLLEEKMRENGRLGRKIEESSRRDQERIQTLEQQVLIYTDDFRSERADRERAQGRIQDLQEEVSRLQQQLHTQGGAGRDVTPTCRVHIGHRISPRRHADPAQPLLGNSATDPPGTNRPSGSHSTTAAAAAATTSSSSSSSAAAMVVVPRPTWTECRGSSELQCPRCLTTYDEAHAAEYLNHCEECARL